MADEIDAKELVTPDIEAVKKAIEIILEFEKTKNISLISRKGRIEFSKIYQKEEARGRIMKMVEDTVKEEIEPLENKIKYVEAVINNVERELKPLDGKINQILRIMTANKIEEIEKPKKVMPNLKKS